MSEKVNASVQAALVRRSCRERHKVLRCSTDEDCSEVEVWERFDSVPRGVDSLPAPPIRGM